MANNEIHSKNIVASYTLQNFIKFTDIIPRLYDVIQVWMYKAVYLLCAKCFRLNYCLSTTYVEKIYVITKLSNAQSVYISCFVKLVNLFILFSTFVPTDMLYCVKQVFKSIKFMHIKIM